MDSSESKKNLSARALGIRFGGSGGLWGTERRPGELQGGLQEPQIMIYAVRRVIMSRQGAAGSPQRAPKEFLESQNDVQSSPGELHRGFEKL